MGAKTRAQTSTLTAGDETGASFRLIKNATYGVGNFYGAGEIEKDMMIAVEAEGIYVKDLAGREYIDCASGTFDQPLGHKHPAIVEAITRQLASVAYVGSPFFNNTLLELADKLIEITPPNLNRVHLRDLSGSTAIEGAVKIAQMATGKRGVLSVFAGHHGQTMFTTDISGNAFRKRAYPQHASETYQVPYADCSNCFYKQKYPSCQMSCVSQLPQFLEYGTSDNIACMIVEPVQGNGGNVVPPKDYFVKLKEFCEKRGIVLIFDEVQTGFGRLGHMFGADYFDVQPHIMVLAKGMSGPVPRAAILVEDRLEKMPRYQHSFSGGSSLLSAAAAIATIEVLKTPGFLENVRSVGAYIGTELKSLGARDPFVGEVRGLGMMWGFTIVDRNNSADVDLCNRIAKLGRRHGLILRTSRYGYGNVIKIRPPLIITREQAKETLARLERTLSDVAQTVT